MMSQANQPNRPQNNMTSFACVVGAHLQQPGQTAVTVPHHVKMTPPTNGQPVTTDPTYAPNVATPLRNLRSDMRPVIVATAAKTPPKNGGNEPDQKTQPENETIPLLNSRVNVPPHRGYVTPPVVGECAHCQRPLTRKSRNGRLPKFCGTSCRVNHWRQSKKEAEAGGGRVVVFLVLIVVAVALWYFWPFLVDVAATRPWLPQPMETAVPEQDGDIIMWPTSVPVQPQAAPTAVPAIPPVIIIPDPGHAPTPVPLVTSAATPETPIIPTAVPVTLAPAAAKLDLDQVETGGETFTLTNGQIVPKATAEFYAACAYNQAVGRRTRPDCPPNAAALLGSGR